MSLQCSFLTGFIHPPNKQTNKQTFDMDAYILQMLTAHDMQDCNSRDAPLPVNFMLSKDDKPQSPSEEQLVVDRWNKKIPTPVTNYRALIK
jgi:hypothetical protein